MLDWVTKSNNHTITSMSQFLFWTRTAIPPTSWTLSDSHYCCRSLKQFIWNIDRLLHPHLPHLTLAVNFDTFLQFLSFHLSLSLSPIRIHTRFVCVNRSSCIFWHENNFAKRSSHTMLKTSWNNILPVMLTFWIAWGNAIQTTQCRRDTTCPIRFWRFWKSYFDALIHSIRFRLDSEGKIHSFQNRMEWIKSSEFTILKMKSDGLYAFAQWPHASYCVDIYFSNDEIKKFAFLPARHKYFWHTGTYSLGEIMYTNVFPLHSEWIRVNDSMLNMDIENSKIQNYLLNVYSIRSTARIDSYRMFITIFTRRHIISLIHKWTPIAR